MERYQVQFHNVSELETSELIAGARLQRYPAAVRHGLSVKGQARAIQSNGCEIRFVTESPSVRISLSTLDSSGKVLVFRGDMFHSSHQLSAGGIQTITLETPERFPEVPSAKLRNRAFSDNVWRLYFDRFSAVFHGVDAFGQAVRPPRPDELPGLSFLAYGSSISQGAGALSHYNGYVQQTARRLEAQALNMALSGSCYCEKAAADHFASRTDWDFAYFELGVNMRGVFSVDEFKQRAYYLLDQATEAHPDKPVFITTIYPNRATIALEGKLVQAAEHEKAYNELLREYGASRSGGNVHVLEGSEIMDDFTSLTTDLIHPSEYGHIRMGENLARLIQPIVEPLRRGR